MDGFTYHNIFETKGLEYLAIIAFFSILVPFFIMLNKEVKIKKNFKKSLGMLTANVLRIPQGLFFSNNHTWTFLEKSGEAKVGIDDLLLHITGDVTFKNLKKPGENIKKGDIIAEIESKGKLLKIASPVSGEIVKINPALKESPDLLNEDPYTKGWMLKVKPSSWAAEINQYYLAESATAFASRELIRFKDFLAVSLSRYQTGVMMQDGGELMDNTLSDLPEEVWQDFQKNFLN